MLIYSTGMQLLLYLRKGKIQLGRGNGNGPAGIHDPSKPRAGSAKIIRYNTRQNSTFRQNNCAGRFDESAKPFSTIIEAPVWSPSIPRRRRAPHGLCSGTVIGYGSALSPPSRAGGGRRNRRHGRGGFRGPHYTQTGLFIALPASSRP